MADPIVSIAADTIGEIAMRLLQLHAVMQVAQVPMGCSLESMTATMQSALLSLLEDRITEVRELVDGVLPMLPSRGRPVAV